MQFCESTNNQTIDSKELSLLLLGSSSSLPTTASSIPPLSVLHKSFPTKINSIEKKSDTNDVSELDAAGASRYLHTLQNQKKDRHRGEKFRHRRTNVKRDYHIFIDEEEGKFENTTELKNIEDFGNDDKKENAFYQKYEKQIRLGINKKKVLQFQLNQSCQGVVRQEEEGYYYTECPKYAYSSCETDSSFEKRKILRKRRLEKRNKSIKDENDRKEKKESHDDYIMRRIYQGNSNNSNESDNGRIIDENIHRKKIHNNNTYTDSSCSSNVIENNRSHGTRRSCYYQTNDNDSVHKKEVNTIKKSPKLQFFNRHHASRGSRQIDIFKKKDQLFRPQYRNGEFSSELNSVSSSVTPTSCYYSSSSSQTTTQFFNSSTKPIFITKDKRQLTLQNRLDRKEAIQQHETQKKTIEQRINQSRTIVTLSLAEDTKKSSRNEQATSEVDEFKDEFGKNIPSDDEDVINKEEIMKIRDAWEVRELLRILDDFNEMTQDDRQEKERKVNYYYYNEKDDEKRQKQYPQQEKYIPYGQRYYHRGVFYMDDDTLAEDPQDIRHKAKEYSMVPTFTDKADRSKMPEVMKVKKFGFQGYSTKYKGLKKEDTTDKRVNLLPYKGVGIDMNKH